MKTNLIVITRAGVKTSTPTTLKDGILIPDMELTGLLDSGFGEEIPACLSFLENAIKDGLPASYSGVNFSAFLEFEALTIYEVIDRVAPFSQYSVFRNATYLGWPAQTVCGMACSVAADAIKPLIVSFDPAARAALLHALRIQCDIICQG